MLERTREFFPLDRVDDTYVPWATGALSDELEALCQVKSRVSYDLAHFETNYSSLSSHID